jgi:hypothetical protein
VRVAAPVVEHQRVTPSGDGESWHMRISTANGTAATVGHMGIDAGDCQNFPRDPRRHLPERRRVGRRGSPKTAFATVRSRPKMAATLAATPPENYGQ